MMLARWSPFFPIATVPSRFEGWTPLPTLAFRHPVDVQRTDHGYRVEAALPGFKPEEIEVSLERGTLTISAKRSEERKTEQGRYVRREVYSGSFLRRLVLPAEVKAEDVQASYEDGMLRIEVAYASASSAVKIPIGAATQPAQTEEPAA